MLAPRLLVELGRGGMGIVYLASTPTDHGDRLVVVKRLRADLASDPESREMLLREARILARLHHPNVVRTFEVSFEQGQYQLVMEWLDGQPLSSLARSSEALPVRLGVFVLAQVLAGLHAAHELPAAGGGSLGLVHRDVSPQNVMVTYDGRVKVVDFGIAKAADGSLRTRTGVVKGKATYMAPEQAARRPVDRRADVFAVGVMLWELLSRRRLWSDSSEREIFAGLRRGVFDSPRRHAREVPADLERACMRAMSADPDGRFATAEAMRLALEAWLEQTGVVASAAELGAFVSDRHGHERLRVAQRLTSAQATASLTPEAVRELRSGFSETYSLVQTDAAAALTRTPRPEAGPSARVGAAASWRLPLISAAALGLAVGSVAFGDVSSTQGSELARPEAYAQPDGMPVDLAPIADGATPIEELDMVASER